MSDAALELDDIQGNVLAGFNTEVQVFVALTRSGEATDAVAAWLAALAPQVSTVREVRAERKRMRYPEPGATPATWLGVALGAELLKALRPDLVVREEAFNGGLLRRSPGALGDRTDPRSWVVGGADAPVDVFLIVAANDEPAAEARTDALVAAAAAAGLRTTYRETARRIGDLEHFGFRDGLSQPTVRGYDDGGALGAGHFIFGYEREPGGSPALPAIDPSGFMRNGSFLVFRRLTQDVDAFRDFCRQAAAGLSANWPGLNEGHLAALIVGRWPSGALASVSVAEDPGTDDNGFDFADDMDGRGCPVGAHIRKVNPRAGRKDLAAVPRLLRRGIPFGKRYGVVPDEPRGLAFLSYQTSIRGQLEALTGTWMNSPFRPAADAGHDLLVGRAAGERSLTITGPRGPVTVSDGGRQWVTPTGGAYLFAPGRSALARMNDPRAPAGLWQVRKFAAAATDLVRAVAPPFLTR